MGGALQRLEILIIGLMFLTAGVVAIVLASVQLPSPAAYLQTTPQPIATSVPATVATPQPTTAVAGTTALMLPRLPTIQLPAIGPDLWLQLLCGAAAIGVALTIRPRNRTGVALSLPETRLPTSALPALSTPPLALSTHRTRVEAAPPELLAPLIAALRSDRAATRAPTWLIEPVEAIALVEEGVRAIDAPAEPPIADEPIELPMLSERLSEKPPRSHATAPRLQGDKLTGYDFANVAALREPSQTASEAAEPSAQAVAKSTGASGAVADNTPGSLGNIVEGQPESPATEGILAAQITNLPTAQPEVDREISKPEKPIASSAEDRVLASAATLATIWHIEGISSPVRSFDTNKADGAQAVLVNVDIHPDDEAAILNLPQLLKVQQPSWQACWRQDALGIELPADGPPPPAGGPLIVPILDHGRGLKMTRFFPLATWRHVGIYGANALHALHALLSSMLYTQPPSNLALAILDQGEITPLYRDVPHLVTPPGDTHATLEAIAGALRRSSAQTTRPLALVMVEPDSAALARLHALLLRLRSQHMAPIHLITAQTQLHSAGRETYALLPALITAGGQGSCSWLPGQGEWPKSGAGRLAARGMRVEGRPHTMDESTLAATLGHLRRRALSELPPVIWESPPAAHQVGDGRSGGEPNPTT